jgi:DNA polymerase (family 10)
MHDNNLKIAKLLRHHAILLKQGGERSRFRLNAYYKAATRIERLDEDIADIDPQTLDGVGKKIANKVAEILDTGDFHQRKELAEAHEDIRDLLRIPGVGPVTAEKFVEVLKKHGKELTTDALKELVDAGTVEVNDNIKTGLSVVGQLAKERIPYNTARSLADMCAGVLETFASKNGGDKPMLMVAGSLRRKKPDIGDIDILICTDKRNAATNKFCESGTVLVKGDKKISKIVGGIQIDMRFTKPDEWGAALLYFTGSKNFNKRMRSSALSKGWTLNEYELKEEATGRHIAGETEQSIFDALGWKWTEPEMRELE